MQETQWTNSYSPGLKKSESLNSCGDESRGATWEAVAKELDISITQAKRIYAAGSEFQPVEKDNFKAAEKYLKLVGEIRDLANEGDLFPTPSLEDIDMMEAYNRALLDASEIEFRYLARKTSKQLSVKQRPQAKSSAYNLQYVFLFFRPLPNRS